MTTDERTIERVERIAVAGDGTIVVAGHYLGGVDLGPACRLDGSPRLGAGDWSDAYVAKLSPDGECLWARRLGIDGVGESFTSLAADDVGHAYVVANAQRFGAFEPTRQFVGRYSADGVEEWMIPTNLAELLHVSAGPGGESIVVGTDVNGELVADAGSFALRLDDAGNVIATTPLAEIDMVAGRVRADGADLIGELTLGRTIRGPDGILDPATGDLVLIRVDRAGAIVALEQVREMDRNASHVAPRYGFTSQGITMSVTARDEVTAVKHVSMGGELLSDRRLRVSMQWHALHPDGDVVLASSSWSDFSVEGYALSGSSTGGRSIVWKTSLE